jgi:hypothetical protein
MNPSFYSKNIFSQNFQVSPLVRISALINIKWWYSMWVVAFLQNCYCKWWFKKCLDLDLVNLIICNSINDKKNLKNHKFFMYLISWITNLSINKKIQEKKNKNKTLIYKAL